MDSSPIETHSDVDSIDAAVDSALDSIVVEEDVQSESSFPSDASSDERFDPISSDARSDGGTDAADAGGFRCAVGALTDSICDFSGMQGHLGWRYGYINLTKDQTFREMPMFGPPEKMGDYMDQGVWRVGDEFWTAITSSTLQPNGAVTTGGRAASEHWPVRRWVSTVAGPITVTVTTDRYLISDLGNGVDAIILVDGTPVWSRFIPTTPTAPVTAMVHANVNVGSLVDMQLNPHMSNDLYDQTYFAVVIRTDSAPAP